MYQANASSGALRVSVKYCRSIHKRYLPLMKRCLTNVSSTVPSVYQLAPCLPGSLPANNSSNTIRRHNDLRPFCSPFLSSGALQRDRAASDYVVIHLCSNFRLWILLGCVPKGRGDDQTRCECGQPHGSQRHISSRWCRAEYFLMAQLVLVRKKRSLLQCASLSIRPINRTGTFLVTNSFPMRLHVYTAKATKSSEK